LYNVKYKNLICYEFYNQEYEKYILTLQKNLGLSMDKIRW